MSEIELKSQKLKEILARRQKDAKKQFKEDSDQIDPDLMQKLKAAE